ncbi:MAG: hypothetical protein NC934_00890 [Candidatus Omnitrophica bacterium]|nr:hypothetical protein [Candidatus Omnitrophota bacterium]
MKLFFIFSLFISFIINGAEFKPNIYYLEWEQISKELKFNLALEKEEFSNLDKEGRIVFGIEKGDLVNSLNELTLNFKILDFEEQKLIFEKEIPLEKGIIVIDFGLNSLEFGEYQVQGEIKKGDNILKKEEKKFRYVKEKTPSNKGKIPLIFPLDIPLKKEKTFPVSFGIPFPKGALWDENNVRIVDKEGKEISCQKIVRARWGFSKNSSIKWLGIDFQAEGLSSNWQNKNQLNYFVEFGPQINSLPKGGIKIEETETGYNVDNGVIKFTIKKSEWNFIDSVISRGKEIFKNRKNNGFYLIDHEGDIYRASNDKEVKVWIEEKGEIKTVFRIDGWYVKDNSEGKIVNYSLPTDKLCKFITRIEVYNNKPYVRVLHTIVFTFDSNFVRLRDMGLSLSTDFKNAFFGIEEQQPFKIDKNSFNTDSIYLIQHLPDKFSIEMSNGKTIKEGKHSEGWFAIEKENGNIIGISNRETWQRFPKEFEVLLNEGLKFHIWPYHGKTHPEIDEISPSEIYKLWFCHQGKELNFAMPWKYYFKTAEIYNSPSTDVYTGPGLVLAGVHSSILGSSVTNDILITFLEGDIERYREISNCFQVLPHCLPEPKWICDSLSVGYIAPYSSEKFKFIEDCIEKVVKGYWELQDYTEQYGMWIYRTWHHTSYKGDKTFDLYRFFNATHHYESFMPWLLYLRSGDPFYLQQARANIRLLSDLNIIHYDDPNYTHKEFHFGQKRIIGSTRHTNGFCPWGGDHALLGHLTCYNGLITAYYLTGDLRLREIVVDEWQKTLVSDRKNPEFSSATRLEPGRDNNNSLGELIDLYQLTYHPALLIYIDDCLKKFLINMYHWGLPLHNVLLFYKSEKAKDLLLEGVIDPKSDKVNLWNTHSPHENYALASIFEIDKEKSKEYAVKSFFASDIFSWHSKGDKLKNKEPFHPFCSISDFILYLPRVIYALSKSDIQDPTNWTYSQSLPGCPQGTYCIVKEEKDKEFNIVIKGIVGKKSGKGFPLKVIGPDKKIIIDTLIEKPYTKLIVPKDGITGEYLIILEVRDGEDEIYVPLTDLEKEVYYVNYWFQTTETKFFTKPKTEEKEIMGIKPHVYSVYILSNKTKEIIASTEKGEKLEIEMPLEGIWIIGKTRYMHLKQSLILSNDEKSWFLPENIKDIQFKWKTMW